MLSERDIKLFGRNIRLFGRDIKLLKQLNYVVQQDDKLCK